MAVHRIHALDITTGNEKSFGPALINALPNGVPGTGDGSSGGVLQFDNLTQNARPGLLLSNGTIFIGYASHCDNGPYHGWLFAYSESSLARLAYFNTTPYGGLGGFWSSGAGLAADSSGNLFLVTGNGSYDTNNPRIDYGDSILKMSYASGAFTVEDYFTPYNQASLSGGDTDLGSGGVLLLPSQPGTFPNELVEAGKQGTIYLVNRDVMTTTPAHYCNGCSSDPEIVQESTAGKIGGMWSMPAYWNNTVYFAGSGDQLKSIRAQQWHAELFSDYDLVAELRFPGRNAVHFGQRDYERHRLVDRFIAVRQSRSRTGAGCSSCFQRYERGKRAVQLHASRREP